MVIEFLTFAVADSDLDEWLAADALHWTRFLEQQDGFVHKEVWRPLDQSGVVHAVVWWQSVEHWKAVPVDELERVTAAMGALDRQAECVSFELLGST